MQFFRNFFKSKFGVPVTLAFVALIGFAFATSDVAMNSTFGGIAGGERVAVVGDEKISSSDLTTAAASAVDSARQQNPTISMPVFIEQGGLDDVLDQLLERTAIAVYAKNNGLRAGDNLVNSEIMNIPAFRGADGNFDQEAYRQALASRRLTDAQVRDDLGQGLLAQQVLVPAAFGAKAPDSIIRRYAALRKESREGSIAILPSAVFAPSDDPSADALQKFYTANRGDFIRPERRQIRYFTFGAEQLGDRAIPTDAEIAAYYRENSAQFAAIERRTVTQLIVPTQQAAEAIRNRVRSGGSLEQAAREARLSTTTIDNATKAEFSSQTSSAVANAIFAAERGTVAAPARSGLGFHVARVDAIDRQAARTLDQARSEIRAALEVQKRRTALTDLAELVDGLIQEGAALPEIAAEVGAQVQTTPALTAAGAVYGTQTRAPDAILPALQTAFEMDEGEPEITEIPPGGTFLVFETADITESAAAPLAEIRDQVIAAYRLSEGSKLAKAAADRVLERLKDGQTLAAAIRAESKPLPAVDSINLSRQQLEQSGQRVPAPLALMFSMAEGTAKKLEAPSNAGWFIVDLENIETGTLADNDPALEQTRRELAQLFGREYAEQMRDAIKDDVEIERNETAIEAVRKALLGER
ncbi:peptidylprolyl isomerase [Erythrobacter sp. HKB08]|uniref:peptidylprolyl isomerase n=1 Tax=Erythrobacter sp. HKB08 TaxID=2502843 RepID=UPI001008CBFA|nr:peptidylprolyl isomerase [Erythrobacter sp. HKB08]